MTKTAEMITIRPGITANEIRHSVTRDGLEVFLSPQLFEIYLTACFRASKTSNCQQVLKFFNAGSIDGGPLTGRKAVQVQRVNLNCKLAPLGLQIKSAGSGFRDRAYELEIRDPDAIDANPQHSPIFPQFVSRKRNARRGGSRPSTAGKANSQNKERLV